MTEQRFPTIPAMLLDALDKAFPERSPELGETVDSLRYRGGQRSVIRFLKSRFEEQSERVTDRTVLSGEGVTVISVTD